MSQTIWQTQICFLFISETYILRSFSFNGFTELGENVLALGQGGISDFVDTESLNFDLLPPSETRIKIEFLL